MIAMELLEAGVPEEGLEVLAEAVGRDPRNGEALANLILAYLQQEETPLADFYLDQATETTERRNPDPSMYIAIGNAYAARHQLSQAVEAWVYARRLGSGDPRMIAELDRAQRELSIARPRSFVRSLHFHLYSDESIPADLVAAVRAHLESEEERLARSFGSPELREPQVVVLYAGQEYFSLVSAPSWVLGMFDGKIRISVRTPAHWSSELAAVLSHELAHAFIRGASHGNAPVWLHEGLAQWCSGKRIPASDFRAELGAGRRPLTLAGMANVSLMSADPGAARAGYAEALGLVEYLVRVRGEGSVFCVVRDLGEGQDIGDALAREASLSPDGLLAAWRAWAGI